MRQRPALDDVVSYRFLRCGGEAERSIARERVKAAVNQECVVVVSTAERRVHGYEHTLSAGKPLTLLTSRPPVSISPSSL